MTKRGRPTAWPNPKTLFSSRLQEILPREGLAKISQKFFLGAAKDTVGKYLSGESEPTVSQILRVAEVTGCNLLWLLTGEGEMEKKKGEPSP